MVYQHRWRAGSELQKWLIYTNVHTHHHLCLVKVLSEESNQWQQCHTFNGSICPPVIRLSLVSVTCAAVSCPQLRLLRCYTTTIWSRLIDGQLSRCSSCIHVAVSSLYNCSINYWHCGNSLWQRRAYAMIHKAKDLGPRPRLRPRTWPADGCFGGAGDSWTCSLHGGSLVLCVCVCVCVCTTAAVCVQLTKKVTFTVLRPHSITRGSG